MRKIVVTAVLVSAVLAAGSEACSSARMNAGGAGSDASVEGEDAARSDGAPPAAAEPDTGTTDASSVDAGADGVDGSSDDANGSPNDAGADAANADGGADADDGANASDAGDGAAGCVPPLGNFAFCGTASATSTYSSSYAPDAVNDGNLTTGWYAASGACGAGACSGDSLRVDIVLDAVRTIGRVKIFGNRDFPTGYDVLTARIDLLDALGAVITAAAVTTSRGAEPNGDVDYVVSPPATSVKTVRVVVLTGESSGPGMAEIQAFAN